MNLIKSLFSHVFETGNSRLNAFVAHLVFSLILLGILLVLIVFFWYPQPYFTGDGGWRGIQIVAGVDLILGPVITLFVFNPKKPRKELVQDMSMILVLQLVALTAGSWIVYDERTRLVVYSLGTFYSLDKQDIRHTFKDEAQWEKLNHGWPPEAIALLPENPTEQSEILAKTFRIGIPLYSRADLVEPMTIAHKKTIADEGIALEKIKSALTENADYDTLVKQFLTKHRRSLEQLAFFPVVFRDALPGLLVLDKTTGQLLNGPEIPLPALGLTINDSVQ